MIKQILCITAYNFCFAAKTDEENESSIKTERVN
uniref:Uncharacterized protein n=1 Tax=Mesocestoides corti TaxID=53468 RepID=A0A5K3EWV9_MESCO